MRSLFLDPGGTTGYAIFEDECLVTWGTCPGWACLPILISAVDEVYYEHVVSNNPSFNPIGLYVIGVIMYLCEDLEKPSTPCPASRVNIPRRWGFHPESSGNPHSTDAISHGIIVIGPNKVELPKEMQRVSS